MVAQQTRILGAVMADWTEYFYLFLVSGAPGSRKMESGCMIAALGNTWSHSVNTRLILQYHDLQTRQVRN